MLGKVRPVFGNTLGMVIGWAFFIFSILAIPLSVITLMRWFQLAWWMALIAVFVISIIPFVGRFAYFGLSIIGAVYLYQAHFSVHDAIGVFVN